jgi:hypothetical protein
MRTFLWETVNQQAKFKELVKFETLTAEECADFMGSHPSPPEAKSPAWLKVTGDSNQLRLFQEF